ncbi:tripartite tricarboxylate transporter substrate-binding protein [Variovorax saccharolyticus]|uniref:tripartite tricarboxylate transporter substrate-binding protein n=1 Tax=Variovorax saccharolyticus TaxID=3053516 RepID=UPI0025761D41|nr:tripartite tricarboxylate transporter substrate-binding protein [Variovorax sp. J22R187]MDM0021132.1 tripartite tricarboxylate transporter substrate-binding protein [Variovorax sp. J22R187]
MRLMQTLPWLLAAVLSAGVAPGASAQVAEGSPARILLAFEGGSARGVAMHLAERMREPLKRPVIVEEKPGAGGRVGALALKNATPDGTTVAMLPIAVPVLSPMTFKDVQYDPMHDFAPISQIGSYRFAFAVSSNHPARSFPEFVAWLKTHPTQAFYGSPAAGSLPHFLGVLVAKAIDIDLTQVAYKGFGPMSVDLMGGTVPAGISSVADLIELHRAGRVRILATSGTRRESQLPEVPTFVEQGYPTVQASGWVGFFAPAKTPRAVINEWSAALLAAIRAPDTRQKLIDLGLDTTGTTPEELSAIMADDIARWAPIVKASGFHAD